MIALFLLPITLFALCNCTPIDIPENSQENSQCAEFFTYSVLDTANHQLTADLTVESDENLYGTWIRLVFDQNITDLVVKQPKNFEIKHLGEQQPNHFEYLLKNNEFEVKVKAPVVLTLAGRYNGAQVPKLREYRLNAQRRCPLFDGPIFNPYKDYLSSLLAHNSYKPLNEQACGTSKPSSWLARLAIKPQTSSDTPTECEGALITPKHLLTSAHCVAHIGTTIPLKQQHLSVFLPTDSATKRQIAKITLHPSYQPYSLLGDLAVVELEETIEGAVPICLTGETKKEGAIVGQKIKEFEGVGVQVGSKIVNCEERLGDWRGIFTDGVFCAAYNKGEECVGRLGGSFVSLREGSKDVWELQGLIVIDALVDNKAKDCKDDSIIVLISTTQHVKWIHSIIQ